MKVALLKHKSLEDTPENYVPKIAAALKVNPDLILGPDYALCFSDNLLDFNAREKIISKIKSLSLNYPKILVVPGTSPRFVGEKLFRHSCPVIQNGKLLSELDKETDYEEFKIGEKVGFNYERGDSTKNTLNFDSKKIAVEICSDHGKQIVDNDTFLEAILAYDENAGFWIRANNDNFSRWAVVVNGLDGKVDGFRYDHLKQSAKYGILSPSINNEFFSVYDLENGKGNISYI